MRPALVHLLLLCATSLRLDAAESWTFVVQAGARDRANTLVPFVTPPGLPKSGRLLATGQEPIPFQVDPDGTGWFVLDRLKAGESREYRVEPRQLRIAPAAQADMDAGQVRLGVRGMPVLAYALEKTPLPRPGMKEEFLRAGYLHPVRTPGGTVVTDDYPSNHQHHHGIWFPWTKTEFQGRQPDFWNMGSKTGTVEVEGLEDRWSGPVAAGFRARHRFMDLSAPTPVAALRETWIVRVFALGPGEPAFHVFDLTSTQVCASDAPLVLPEYHYGGLGFRGHWDWNGKDATHFLTSEGETNRIKGHATRARWCHIGGRADGTLAGIAILCHPANFRAPQPMRIHPTEPFFCFAPQQSGPMAIKPGEPYVSHYRFIVADGPPDAAAIDRLWNDFADPPRVVIRGAR